MDGVHARPQALQLSPIPANDSARSRFIRRRYEFKYRGPSPLVRTKSDPSLDTSADLSSSAAIDYSQTNDENDQPNSSQLLLDNDAVQGPKVYWKALLLLRSPHAIFHLDDRFFWLLQFGTNH